MNIVRRGRFGRTEFLMPCESMTFANCFAGKRVWVSGVSGFKGAWLAEWLVSLGAEVVGFSLPPPTSPSLFLQSDLGSRISWDCGDLRDPDTVKKSLLAAHPDFVFHLAAQPLVRFSYDEPVATWETNVMGSIHVMEALRGLERPCAAVMVTTDKCYDNREWLHGYREEDALGGYDPYSSSKAACEMAISSWRRSFFGDHPVKIASARAGNVIGGGDWALERIVPDCVRALQRGEPIAVRNKTATRPWQHVLEPLGGYLILAMQMAAGTLDRVGDSHSASAMAFNFGPELGSNRTVAELVQEILKHWPGNWVDECDPKAPHEAGKLNLATDKAFHTLGWRPKWDFETTIKKTVEWYLAAEKCRQPKEFYKLTVRQIEEYNKP